MSTVRHHSAVGVHSARALLKTRQDAFVVHAALVRVAIVVRFALVLDAFRRWVASVAART